MQRKAWGMCLFLIYLGLWLSPIHPSSAAAPSVIPPANMQAGFYPISPTTNTSTYFKTQPTWYRMTNVGTPVTGWTIVHAGEDLQLRAVVAKTGWDWFRTASLSITIQKDQGSIDNFSGDWNAVGDPAMLAATAQYGLVYQTGYIANLAMNNEDIRYEMKVPEVTRPTWYTLQINVNLTFGTDPLRTISSNLVRVLVIPTNYSPTLTPEDTVLFNGQSATLAVEGLDVSIVPDYQFASTPALTTEVAGNQLQTTATGAVSSTPIQAQIQFAPMFGGEAPVNIDSSVAVVDTANLPDVTVNEDQPATFDLQLPSGLTATNTRWYVGNVLQTAKASELVISSAKTNADVYAISDFKRGQTTVAQNVQSNLAKLTVIPARHDYALNFSEPFLFVKDGSAARMPTTDQLKAQVNAIPDDAGPIAWHAYQPDSKIPSTLVQVTADGTVIAGPDPGSVDIEADFTTATTTQSSVRRLDILKLPDTTANANEAVNFRSPIPPSGQLLTNSWYFADGEGNFADQPTAFAATSTIQGPVVTSAQNNRQLQVSMQVQADGQQYTLNSNLAKLIVTPPAGLVLQAVPSFYFTNNNATPPTVSELIAGDAALTPANGPQQLVISDNRATAGAWQLSVEMTDLKSMYTQATLGANGGVVLLKFDGEQAPGTVPIKIGASPTNITSLRSPVAVWNVSAKLNLPKITAPPAGVYDAQLHWTLAATPTPPAP
ncbi:hypothetical protein [Lacticaseibacillus porcinae]|uniref:hypothetical protein n=1 Tax=Lacticaseibacillus porcinae TaxID=1123687 RepID=UPI000F7AAB3B|nr:hypothetical protein [Lacticaseibacillus porcinae]